MTRSRSSSRIDGAQVVFTPGMRSVVNVWHGSPEAGSR